MYTNFGVVYIVHFCHYTTKYSTNTKSHHAAAGVRTQDLPVKGRLLFQLSYRHFLLTRRTFTAPLSHQDVVDRHPQKQTQCKHIVKAGQCVTSQPLVDSVGGGKPEIVPEVRYAQSLCLSQCINPFSCCRGVYNWIVHLLPPFLCEGWLTGFEPAWPGTTIRCITISATAAIFLFLDTKKPPTQYG